MAYTAIDDGTSFFHTQLYTGTGANQDVVNDAHSGDFKPDLLWIKNRGHGSYGPHWYDSSRGVKRYFYSDQAYGDDLEQYNAQGNSSVQLFNTNGFRGGSSTNIYQILWINGLNNTYVAWQWKANGGTTSSNTDGNITSTVQANTNAGFSIVTYTGNGSNNQTIGHGLGVQPSWWVVKRRDADADWWFGASSILGGTSNYLKLNSTAANASSNNIWGDSPASSSVFRVSNNANLNASGGTYVAYLFANKQGYSKFGGYIANGNADGPFVYTGFKPAFLMLKNATNSGYNWWMLDNKRNPSNLTDEILYANLTAAEFDGSGHATNMGVDFLSNGFKVRTTNTAINNSGGTNIYMAFAENPFVAGGVPTTAR